MVGASVGVGGTAFGPLARLGRGDRDPGWSPNVEVVVDYRAAIEEYYGAFRERDLAALRALLTPDFHFVSSFGEYHQRDAMLEEIWPAVGQTWAKDLRVFGSGPEFVVLYEHEHTTGVERPPMRMAEYVRFEGDRIAEIEVYVGRPVA